MKFKEYNYLCKKIQRKAKFEITLILSICLLSDLIFYNLPIDNLTKQLLIFSMVFAFISFSMIVYTFYNIKIKYIDEEGIDDDSSGIYNKKEII